jgi:lysophospholipase L1-like esterase
MKRNLLSYFLFLGLASQVLLAQDKPFYLHDGDRVVFYGDSITDQRLYTTFTESYVVTRFPQLNVTFVHSGWGGDRVSGGGGGGIDLRLERDVFAYQPTVMTIMLGMNDGGYRALNDDLFERYRNGLEHIVDSVKGKLPSIRLTLIQPSPFDDVTQPPRFEGGYNSVLVRYGQFVKELAEREHATVADLNAPLVAELEKAKSADPELAKKVIPDRVHPGPAGHLLMAAELLKAWNAPSTVAVVELDATEGKVTQSQSAKVSGLKSGGEKGTWTWTELDEALPMPLNPKDSLVELALKSSDFVQALDQEPLKVTGLTQPKYKLIIDGSPVGEFTKEQLAEGVNLATLPTPMLSQANDVHQLTLRHNDLHAARWRQIQVPMARFKNERIQKATQDLMTALDEEEANLIQQQRSEAQPKEHRFELTPAASE